MARAFLGCFLAATLPSCRRAEPPVAPVGTAPDRTERPGQVAGLNADLPGVRRIAPGIVQSILDPRMESLLHAADQWRRRVGPDRIVVDQVYLVPDVPTFLEVIAAWDQRRFFPILIDDPAWTLPFLRAFRPARVVRVQRAEGRPAGPRRESETEWQAAQRAVALAWISESVAEADVPSGGRVPRGVGPTPPAVVLSYPESPTLAGAVALAAGRFQPLVRLEPIVGDTGPDSKSGPRPKRFADRLSLDEARAFARKVEAIAGSVAGPHGGLGDSCDFLTLAGDWPYAYRNDVEDGQARGEHALDDLIGRVLDGSDSEPGLARRGPAGPSPAGCWGIRRRASTGPCAPSSSSPGRRCSGTRTAAASSGRITT